MWPEEWLGEDVAFLPKSLSPTRDFFLKGHLCNGSQTFLSSIKKYELEYLWKLCFFFFAKIAAKLLLKCDFTTNHSASSLLPARLSLL